MIKVLFVCLGNICRSPMAEAMFRDAVKREGLEEKIIVDSAGTGDWHIGQPPHKGTLEILRTYKIDDRDLCARQIKASDLEEFDYIIAMDSKNKEDIEKLQVASPRSEVQVLLDYLPHITDKNVPDPYFTGDFQGVYELIKESCEVLLQRIIATNLNDEGGKGNE